MNYCEFCQNANADDPNIYYHDNEYGFPLTDDSALFGRFILEIMQAGLSWTTILRKRYAIQNAFDDFAISKIAHYTDQDITRLMNDSNIIRNRRKIEAIIFNAKAIQKIQHTHQSFKNWLDTNYPLPLEDWVKLFKQHFRFVGHEIVKEFLISTAYLEGAHSPDCPISLKIAQNKSKEKSAGKP